MLSLTLGAINREEALRYMGYHGVPDTAFSALVDDCEKKLIQAAQPRVIYRVLTLQRENSSPLSAGTLPLPGNDIAKHLNNCDRILLMAATLSVQTDQLIHRAGISDMTKSLVLDALASAGIEQICNRAETIFQEQLPGIYFTWRFSPGYGDLPLELQPQILQLLDAQKRLGLTVTPENILVPRKSVTAVIGLSEQPLKKGVRGCATCRMRETCTFRKGGTHC